MPGWATGAGPTGTSPRRRGRDDVEALAAYGRAYATRAHWDRATDLYAQALAVDPGYLDAWRGALDVGMGRGDRAGLAGLFRDFLRRFGDTDDPGTADAVIHRLLVLGDTTAPPEQVARLAQLAITPSTPTEAYRNLIRGMVSFRAGRFEQALIQLTHTEWSRLDDPWLRANCARDLFFTAMAQHRLGNPDAARAKLAEGIKLLDTWPWRDEAGGPRDVGWSIRARAETVRAEAEALLGHGPGPETK
jgi:tetratricopeptide (TPR) repeat protein